MSSNALVEWVAEISDEIIATGAMAVYQFPPTYTNASGRKGYVMNMYTKPEYRRQGLGTRILNEIECEAKQLNIKKLFLIASKMGRPVYREAGFMGTEKYMEKDC